MWILAPLLAAAGTQAAVRTDTTFDIAIAYPDDGFGHTLAEAINYTFHDISNDVGVGIAGNQLLPSSVSLILHEYPDDSRSEALFHSLRASGIDTGAKGRNTTDVVATDVVVGHFYSGSSMVWADTMREFDVPLVSPSATSTALSDRAGYPTFNRVIASNRGQAQAMGALAVSMHWDFLFIVHEDESYSGDLAAQLDTQSHEYFYTVRGKEKLASTPSDEECDAVLDQIVESRTYLISLIGYELAVARLLYRAGLRGMLEKPYIWIGGDTVGVDTLFPVFTGISGTTADVLNGSLFAIAPTGPNNEIRTDFCTRHYVGRPCAAWQAYASDAARATAIAVGNLMELRTNCTADSGSSQHCSDMLIGTQESESRVLNALLADTSFVGASGTVAMSDGERQGGWGLVAARNGTFSELGQVGSDGRFAWFKPPTDPSMEWPCGYLPGELPTSGVPSFHLSILHPHAVMGWQPRRGALAMIEDINNGRVMGPDGKPLLAQYNYQLEVSSHAAYNNDEVTFDSLIVNGIDVREANSTEEVVQSHVIIGSMWSGMSIRAATLSAQYKTPLISPSATSTALSDRSAYPTFSRVIGSNSWQARALLASMLRFRWMSFYVIWSGDAYSQDIWYNFEAHMAEYNAKQTDPKEKLTLLGSTPFDSRDGADSDQIEWQPVLNDIKRTKALVTITFMYEYDLPRLMLAMQKEGMLGAPYTLIGVDSISVDGLFTQSIASQLDMSGLLAVTPTAPSNALRTDFCERHRAAFAAPPSPDANSADDPPSECVIWHLLGADAVHAAALALDHLAYLQTTCKNETMHPLMSPEDLSDCVKLRDGLLVRAEDPVAIYRVQREIILKRLPGLAFEGRSGTVAIDGNAERADGGGFGLVNSVKVDGKMVWREIAQVSDEGMQLFDDTDIVWPAGFGSGRAGGQGNMVEANGVWVPGAYHEQLEHIRHVSVGLFALVIVLVALMSVVLLALLYFNTKYRECRIIRMSSPTVNSVTLVGAIVAILSIAVWGIDTHYVDIDHMDTVCAMRVWLSAIAFSVMYASMFAKIMRVWRIFRSAEMLERTTFTLTQVLALIGAAVFVDLVLLTAWQLDAPVTFELTLVEESLTPDSRLLKEMVGECRASNSVYPILLLVYKGLMLFVGASLAYSTRHVEIPALNDSRLMGVAIYLVSTGFILVTIAGYIVEVSRMNERFALLAFAALAAVGASMGIVFAPKLLAVHRGTDWGGPTSTMRSRTLHKTGSSTTNTHNASTGTGTAGITHSRDSSSVTRNTSDIADSFSDAGVEMAPQV